MIDPHSANRSNTPAFLRETVENVLNATPNSHARAAFLAEIELKAGLGSYTVNLVSGECQSSSPLLAILGLEAGENAHEVLAQRVCASDGKAMAASLARLLAAGGDDEFEHCFQRSDGRKLSLRTRRRVVCDARGQPQILLCSVQDLTEQKYSASELRDSELRFRTLLDFATDTYMLHSQDGAIVDVNSRACESFGYTREEFIGQKPSFFSETVTPKRLKWILGELNQGRTVAFDSVHRRKDGSTFPAEVRIRPVVLDGTRFAVTLSRNIAKRNQAELALRESEELYRLALETAKIGTWQYEAANRIVHLDLRAQNYWGIAKPNPTIDDVIERIHPADIEMVRECFGLAFAPGSKEDRVDLEHRIVFPDGSVRWLSARALIRFEGNGNHRKVISIIGTTLDITDQRNAVLALEGQSRVFEHIATGQPINSILEEITRFVEHLIPESQCEIFRVPDGQSELKFAAGQRMPEPLKELVVPIGENSGSCGHAAWSGETTIAANTSTDFKWQRFSKLVEQYSLRSCWSVPIFEVSQGDAPSGSQLVLGTLAVYRTFNGVPDEHARLVLKAAARLAGIAISSNRAVQDLREGETRYAVVSEITRIVTFGLSVKRGEPWQFMWSRPQVGMLSGYDREELLALGWAGIIHPDDHAKCETLLAEIMSRTTSKTEVRIVTKTGQVLDVQVHAKLHSYDPETGSATLIGGLLDITDFKAVETALRKSEERFALAVSGTNDGLWDWNLATNEVFFSPRWKTMLGYEPVEIADTFESWRSLLHPDELELVTSKLADFLSSTSTSYDLEFRMRTKDGGYRTIQSRGTLSRDANGQPTRMVGTHRDLTERKTAELALRRSEEFLRRAQVMAHVGNWTLDLETQVFACSEEAARIFELEGLSCTLEAWLQMVHHDDLPRLRQAYSAMLAGAPFELEYRLVFGNRMKWVSSKASLELDGTFRTPHLVGVTQDISARNKLEEQLRQSQKMDAFGQLAGGVAHDFNNLLTVINGFSELLLAEMSKEEPRREFVEQIQQAGERAAALTRQLLTLGRRQFTERRIIDLNEIVVRSESMLKRLIGENIHVQAQLRPDLPNIKADPGQIDQVILNLVVNARDAMPLGGRLGIRTDLVSVAPSLENTNDPGLASGEYVEFLVSDTGTGMTEEVRARIFEPFFSTKGVGKGTGLGLSTVYGIVQQSQGSISVDSELGVGTTFRILLPIDCSQATPPAMAPSPPVARGSETILVAEDEEIVRHIVVTTLQSQGYTVYAADSGEAALTLAKQLPASPQVLITDMVMPGITGTQLAERLRAQHPKLKVLYMSGYTDDKFVRQGLFTAPDDFIQKPFTPTTLNLAVQALLRAGTPAGN